MGRRPSHKDLPEARSQGLLVEEIGSELVVLDTESSEAHSLSPLAAAVFTRCDGRTGIDQIAELVGSHLGEPVGVDEVRDALAQLEERELLARRAEAADGAIDGITRRAMVRRTAVATAALSAAPMVTSIVTPAHAQIQSPTPGCPNSQCASQFQGDEFCSTLGCPDPEKKPRDSCECELCTLLLSQKRVSFCPTPIPCSTIPGQLGCPSTCSDLCESASPAPCTSNCGGGRCTGTQGGTTCVCTFNNCQNKFFADGQCIQRVGDTSEPCFGAV